MTDLRSDPPALHPSAPALHPTLGKSTLRQRILGFVCALIVLSLLGSTLSLYRVTEVNRLLDAINGVSVPLGRLFVQLQSDAELYHREVERSLGESHWKDPRWNPRPVPKWANEMLESEVARAGVLISGDPNWAPLESRDRWQDWASSTSKGFSELSAEATRLQASLESHDANLSARSYQRWNTLMDEWTRQLQAGAGEYDHSFRQTFSLAEKRMTELRTGLEMILVVVVCLSLLLLWLGERALRPLAELTTLAREITRRGLRKEHKSLLPEIPLNRRDEVSQLGREFHHMATALLEREKTVEAQKHRLQEQNTLLRRMGELNENILHSIESILLVTDLHGTITQCNPLATRWLASETVIGRKLSEFPKIADVIDLGSRDWLQGKVITALKIDHRDYSGHVMPLRSDASGSSGAILVLDDVTDRLDLQERVRSSEHMAAVGRMSAQVAHEVRNPLHSIGLEAEMAAEMAAGFGSLPLKQSIASILGAVDRLEKITDNYLRLSRLSTGQKQAIDISELLMSVLATYATQCEAQRVRVDWKSEPGQDLCVMGDRDLLEQALGNLMRNSLQALEVAASAHKVGQKVYQEINPDVYKIDCRINWAMGVTESDRVWIRVEDNGPGIPSEIQEKLFNPFVTTRAQGTGLGLAFVKRVIEEHGGTVNWVSSAGSPHSGRANGARFDVLLPRSYEYASAAKPEENLNVQI